MWLGSSVRVIGIRFEIMSYRLEHIILSTIVRFSGVVVFFVGKSCRICHAKVRESRRLWG